MRVASSTPVPSAAPQRPQKRTPGALSNWQCGQIIESSAPSSCPDEGYVNVVGSSGRGAPPGAGGQWESDQGTSLARRNPRADPPKDGVHQPREATRRKRGSVVPQEPPRVTWLKPEPWATGSERTFAEKRL